MFRSKLHWILAGVALLVVGTVAARLINRPTADASKTSALPVVNVISPTLGNVATRVSLTGVISARNEMPIGPEGEGGRIAAVMVEVGDRVRRGQLLARIDPVVAESQVAAAAAALEDARAQAASAQADFKRAEGARDAFSVEEYEKRRTQAVTAQAKVNLADAQLREARTRWGRTNITAPSAGIVLTRTAEVGQIAMPGSSVLFRLAQDAELEMRGQVAEQDMPRLKPGQATRVFVSGVSKPYEGAIINSQTRQGSARIVLPVTDQNLRPGAFARAEVEVAAEPGVIVPQTAVLTDEAGNYVLVVDREARVARRAVNVAGAQSEGLLVTSGISDSDRIVATAGAFLRVGEQVEIAAKGPIAARAGGAGSGKPSGGLPGNAAAP
jgi:HlyD family secretion protein